MEDQLNNFSGTIFGCHEWVLLLIFYHYLLLFILLLGVEDQLNNFSGTIFGCHEWSAADQLSHGGTVYAKNGPGPFLAAINSPPGPV